MQTRLAVHGNALLDWKLLLLLFFWKGLSLVGNIQQSAISANNVRTTEKRKKTESIIKVAKFRQLI